MHNKIEKILIIKPSSLGDIVHSFAFLNSLKNCFPDTKVHWIVAKEFENLLEEHPMIDNYFTIDKEKWKKIGNFYKTFKELLEFRKQLRQYSYEFAIDLQGLLRSGIITAFSRAKIKIGFKQAREFSTIFYNKKISAPIQLHAVERYLEIAKALGCKIDEIKFPLPKEIEPEWLRDYDNYVVIIPSARWQSKNWPLPYYVELVKMLPFNFLVVGSRSDGELAINIEKYTKGKAISLAGKTTLRELIAIFKKALFVITPDTGTMHLAVASGKKVVSLFGPTSPSRTGPYGDGHLIIKADLDCSPCFRKFCPELKCMREIKPHFVYEEILKWRNL